MRPVANLESSVRVLANELIDGFIDDGECEFVDAFAVGGILFHQLYYIYGSAAFAWCRVERCWLTLQAVASRAISAR